MDAREMSRIGGDPELVRSTARTVKRLLGAALTEWQDEFLTRLCAFEGPDRLSTRQCETLMLLRDRATRRRQVAGYSAHRLLASLTLFDLSEEDEAFVRARLAEGADCALSNPEWAYLLGLCRRQQVIDDAYIALP